jgi:hypothetical protein
LGESTIEEIGYELGNIASNGVCVRSEWRISKAAIAFGSIHDRTGVSLAAI